MEAYKFETTVLENGVIKIPEISNLKNQKIEVFVVVKSNEKLTFEEWNNQFTDNKDLDEFLPEYGMTLRKFRQKIYDTEIDESISMKEFKESVKNW